MAKPLIGITVGEIYNRELPWGPLVHGQSQTYVDAVLNAGGVPVILPLVGDKDTLLVLYEHCDGLLFSGGNDVNPALYGEQKKDYTEDISIARDEQEMQLARWALGDDKPMLGICRGMQLLNVVFGGSLYQDIAAEITGAHNHSLSRDNEDFSYIAHEELRIEPGSRLAKILEATTIQANALHHQAVKRLGRGLRAVAWAEDDVIEAFELAGAKFMIGVQSHPEALEEKSVPRWRKLFEAFVVAAS